MGIDQIQANCEELNRQHEKKPKTKKPVIKTNGHTVLNMDEQLKLNAARIVAAFSLESKGVTVDKLFDGVKAYEQPYQGTVQ